CRRSPERSGMRMMGRQNNINLAECGGDVGHLTVLSERNRRCRFVNRSHLPLQPSLPRLKLFLKTISGLPVSSRLAMRV
ncbi:unnamed protein product, partial [Mycena citricolor]